MADKNYSGDNYGAKTETNTYRSISDVLSGTKTVEKTLVDKEGREIATGYGHTDEGAQKDLEEKLDKK